MSIFAVANYRMIRRLRPEFPWWVAAVTVRNMETTYRSDLWNVQSILLCAGLVANWPMSKAIAFRGAFMVNKLG